jgi:DNA-binding PadR family transcriptional regulator
VASRNRSNTLSLAVLVCLYEKPMHPYEVATTLRQRHKHESVRLNYGSLYSVVESLAKRGLIVAQETERSGRLPERTVYALTDLGREEIVDWLSTLISTPTKEYPSFEAALSFIGALSPDEVVRLLQERALHLEVLIAQWEGTRGVVEKRGLPRLFYIEEEFAKALIERELEFVRDLIDDIVGGTLEGVDFWRRIHAGDGRPELGHGIEVLQEGVTPPWKK